MNKERGATKDVDGKNYGNRKFMLAAWVPFLHPIAISPMFPISRADIKSEPGAAMSEEEAQKVQKNMKNRR